MEKSKSGGKRQEMEDSLWLGKFGKEG